MNLKNQLLLAILFFTNVYSQNKTNFTSSDEKNQDSPYNLYNDILYGGGVIYNENLKQYYLS